MYQADIAKKPLAEKATFLEGLGLDRREAAVLLGTTYASITQTLSNQKKTKEGKRADGTKQVKQRQRK
jgi:hypothetical protein